MSTQQIPHNSTACEANIINSQGLTLVLVYHYFTYICKLDGSKYSSDCANGLFFARSLAPHSYRAPVRQTCPPNPPNTWPSLPDPPKDF